MVSWEPNPGKHSRSPCAVSYDGVPSFSVAHCFFAALVTKWWSEGAEQLDLSASGVGRAVSL